MLHVGRSLLLVLGFLSLQLSLLSGGERCPVASVFSQAGNAMAGMDMDGMDMAAMDMSVQPGDDKGDARASHHEEQSCDHAGASTSCDSMTVCVFAAVIAPGSIRHAQSLPMERAPRHAVRIPPTEGVAPDLPPPRLPS